MRGRQILIALAMVGLACSTSRGELVQVNFSGGNGTPITLTLPQPVSFTVTAAFTGKRFGFKDAGHLLDQPTTNAIYAAIGDMTFTTNGGAAAPINGIGSLDPPFAPNDVLLTSSGGLNTFAVGDVLVLSAGSTTTAVAVPLVVSAPPSGMYEAVLFNSAGVEVAEGVAVPEPAGACVLGGLAALALRTRRRVNGDPHRRVNCFRHGRAL